MKKTLLFVTAIAAVLFAASCTVGPEGPSGADGAVVMFQNGLYPSAAYAGCVDTGIESSAPTVNYGDSTTIAAAGLWASSTVYRYMIKFDVSYITPSNVNVTEAYLELIPWQATGANTITAYAITKNWIEGQATWNNFTTASAWNLAGGDFGTQAAAGTISYGPNDDNKTFRLSLNADTVKSWITDPASNYGVMLVAQNESSGTAYFNSVTSEDSQLSERPRLVVKYTLP